MTTRLSVNINDETATALRAMAHKRDATVTEELRRAVGTLVFLRDSEANGLRITTTDLMGATVEVKFLW